MKHHLIALFCLFSINAFSKVELYTTENSDENFGIYLNDNNMDAAYSAGQIRSRPTLEGSGTSETQYEVYIPYTTRAYTAADCSADNIAGFACNLTIMGAKDPEATKPSCSENCGAYDRTAQVIPVTIDTGSGYDEKPRLHFYVSHDQADHDYLGIAVKKSDSDWQTVNIFNTSSASRSAPDANTVYDLIVEYEKLCDELETCTIATSGDDADEGEEEIEIYIFSSDNAIPSSFDNPDEDYPDGIYFNLNFSNVYPCNINGTGCTSSEERPTNPGITKGDLFVGLTYDGSNLIDAFDEETNSELIVATSSATIVDADDKTIQEIISEGYTFRYREDLEELADTVKVPDLVNGVTYNFSYAFTNKYQFVSYFSNDQEGTPALVEVFLEKQQCYLISAGFKKEHYVLDFFREVRDQILLKNSWGRKFINFYYETAPQYARKIWNSPFMSSSIRFFSRLFYTFTLRKNGFKDPRPSQSQKSN